MRKFIIPMAALALVACAKTEPADPTVNDAAADMAAANAANDAAAAATPAAFDINSTSWEFIDPETKKPSKESIDASGNYVQWAGTSEHLDHGKAVMKDGKACFTSAMTKDGEMCWTDPKLEVGASGESTNDKGEKLALKRIEYVVAPPF